MSVLVKQVEDKLCELVRDAAKKAMAAGELPEAELTDFKVEIPADRKNGDYSTNAAMAWARAFRRAPAMIAAAITKNIDLEGTAFSSCEAAGPGFINFRLADRFYSEILMDIRKKGSDYGRSDFGKGEKVNIEFVSANPTGPMHMGNARGGALGDCLAAVMDFAGYNVSREFYINDAGNQIDKFALSLDIRYQQIYKGADAPELPEDSYHGEDIAVRAREFADIYGDKYISESEEVRRKALVDFALPKNIDSMHEILSKYRIEYDTWFNESTLHNGTELHDTIELLKEKGLTYELDGALWYKNIEVQTKRLLAQGKTQEEIDKLGLKDDVLIRQNGNPTYFAADIAYHRNKLAVRKFDRAIDVWGADHHGHVARLKGAIDALGLDGTNRLDIVLMQLVKLVRDGEVVRMSKRTGKTISLSDLLDEIPVDACRYFFNAKPDTQMDFDLGLAVREDSENPVYYIQYAYARICSLLKTMADEGRSVPAADKADLSLLSGEQERALIKELANFSEEIRMAARDYDPSYINRYLMRLAGAFHRFYNACRIKGEADDVANARLLLAAATRQVLANGLTILGLSKPEKM